MIVGFREQPLISSGAVVDLGPYDEPVEFAWPEASKLKHSFIRAADVLTEQLSARQELGERALREWRGVYAREFENSHMEHTLFDAVRLIAQYEHAAQMLSQLSNLAREEKERRQVAMDWKEKHDKWVEEQRERSAGEKFLDWGLGDDEPKPPELPEIKPQPYVATGPPMTERG